MIMKFPAHLEADSFHQDMCSAQQTLGTAYSFIAEANILEVLQHYTVAHEVRRKAIERELTRIARYTTEFKVKIKASMHKRIIAEAESILLDG